MTQQTTFKTVALTAVCSISMVLAACGDAKKRNRIDGGPVGYWQETQTCSPKEGGGQECEATVSDTAYVVVNSDGKVTSLEGKQICSVDSKSNLICNGQKAGKVSAKGKVLTVTYSNGATETYKRIDKPTYQAAGAKYKAKVAALREPLHALAGKNLVLESKHTLVTDKRTNNFQESTVTADQIPSFQENNGEKSYNFKNLKLTAGDNVLLNDELATTYEVAYSAEAVLYVYVHNTVKDGAVVTNEGRKLASSIVIDGQTVKFVSEDSYDQTNPDGSTQSMLEVTTHTYTIQ